MIEKGWKILRIIRYHVDFNNETNTLAIEIIPGVLLLMARNLVSMSRSTTHLGNMSLQNRL